MKIKVDTENLRDIQDLPDYIPDAILSTYMKNIAFKGLIGKSILTIILYILAILSFSGGIWVLGLILIMLSIPTLVYIAFRVYEIYKMKLQVYQYCKMDVLSKFWNMTSGGTRCFFKLKDCNIKMLDSKEFYTDAQNEKCIVLCINNKAYYGFLDTLEIFKNYKPKPSVKLNKNE